MRGCGVKFVPCSERSYCAVATLSQHWAHALGGPSAQMQRLTKWQVEVA